MASGGRSRAARLRVACRPWWYSTARRARPSRTRCADHAQAAGPDAGVEPRGGKRVAVDLGRPGRLHLDPDLAADEPDRVPRRRGAVTLADEQLHRAADPADDPATRQDEDVEQAVIGLDGEARAEETRDRLAGVRDEHDHRFELRANPVD